MSSNFSTDYSSNCNPQKGRFSAKKSLGQNFFNDPNIVNKIVASAMLNKNSIVLEIGPGLGALTLPLSYHSKKIVAIEKDDQLTKELKNLIKNLGIKNIEIINSDILKEFKNPRDSQMFKKLGPSYQVVANIPYCLTGPIIRALLETNPQPEEITLIVQKEVAQRICNIPPNMSLLSIAVQYYANPKILFYISKNCFYPIPKVDSAALKLSPIKNYSPKDAQFFKVVKAGFLSPRKQLLNNLSTGLKIDKEKIKASFELANLDYKRRAETLEIGDWEGLIDSFKKLRIKF